VVGDHHNLFRVEDLFYTNAFEFADSNGCSDVIGKDKVSPHVDKFTRRNLSLSAVHGEYFLGEIHIRSSLFESSLFIVLWGWKVWDEENCQNNGGNNSRNQVEPCPSRQTNTGGCPDSGGSGQPFNPTVTMQYGASTEETNAGNNASGNSRGVAAYETHFGDYRKHS
jgi:hypothetical protein